MIAFPNAKINLGLNVVSRREDGYHNIESCFYPVQWRDILEIVPSSEFEFTVTGLEIPGEMSSNLCVKAYEMINRDFDIEPVRIHLHKLIPMGAGLGGGSSDGTFTLKVLNDLFELNLSPTILREYASQLGSDCPFFVDNEPVYVTGTGNSFHNIDLDLSGYQIAIVHPGEHVSTQVAYEGIVPAPSEKSILDILETSAVNTWQKELKNDFEHSVISKIPKIEDLKKTLYKSGALYSSMTGSGSAVYGVFPANYDLKPVTIAFESEQSWLGTL